MTEFAASIPIADTLPADPQLLGLPVALDPRAVTAIVGARLAPGFQVVSPCRVVYVRYKPHTSCIVAYEVALRDAANGDVFFASFHGKCHRREDWELVAAKLTTHRFSAARGLPAVVAASEIHTMFYAFPNDPGMPGLRLVGDRKRLRRFLAPALAEYPVAHWRLSDSRLHFEVVRFKPGRRAVVRVETRAVHRTTGERRPIVVWLRVYSGNDAGRVARRSSELEAAYDRGTGPRVARVLTWDEALGIVVCEPLPGLHPSEASSPEVMAAIGRSLARLHTTPGVDAPTRGVTALLDDAAAAADALARVAPERLADITRIHAAIRNSAPCDPREPRLVHGDLHLDQILLHHGQVAFLDFDRSYAGDPLADVGNLLAHLRLGRHGNAAWHSNELAAEFVRAHAEAAGTAVDAEGIRFWTLYGMWLAAIRPFRCWQKGWKAAIDDTLAACEELIV